MIARRAIRISPKVAARIASLPPVRKQRVRDALREIARDPESGKQLEDELGGFYSWPVPPLRIVYEIGGSEIHIRIVELRRTVYEEFIRQLTAETGFSSS